MRVYTIADIPELERTQGRAAYAGDRVNLATAPAECILLETDQEIMDRMRRQFSILDDMARATKAGHVRALILSGPPGVGKSFGVEKVLGVHEMMAQIVGDDAPKKYEVVKGGMSAIGLYTKLYELRHKKCVLVLDDCTGIFYDDEGLDVLKAALDSSKKRTISWNKASRVLKDADIPNSFEFEGGVIFITNISFDDIKSKTLREHLAALESRCHYMDLGINTTREKMLRIKQIISDGMLDDYDFDDGAEDEIVEFIATNKDTLRELSLRMVLKLADLRASFPINWRNFAEETCLRK